MSDQPLGAPAELRSEVPSKEEMLALFGWWSNTHPLHTHPYLTLVCDPSNQDVSAVNRLAEVLYELSALLQHCALTIAANTCHDDIRRTIVASLHKDYGDGDRDRDRRYRLSQLLNCLGYTELTPITLNAPTVASMRRIADYCRREGDLKGLSCICIGAEFNAYTCFRKVAGAFTKKRCLRASGLDSNWCSRASGGDYRQEMVALIEPYLSGAESRLLIHEGLMASVSLFQELWASMLPEQAAPTQMTGLA